MHMSRDKDDEPSEEEEDAGIGRTVPLSLPRVHAPFTADEKSVIGTWEDKHPE